MEHAECKPLIELCLHITKLITALFFSIISKYVGSTYVLAIRHSKCTNFAPSHRFPHPNHAALIIRSCDHGQCHLLVTCVCLIRFVVLIPGWYWNKVQLAICWHNEWPVARGRQVNLQGSAATLEQTGDSRIQVSDIYCFFFNKFYRGEEGQGI